MSPSPEEHNLDTIVYRLSALERSHERLAEQILMSNERVQHTINGLSYVPLALYVSERDAMRATVESTRALSMWALGLVASAVIVGLVGLLVSVAT